MVLLSQWCWSVLKITIISSKYSWSCDNVDDDNCVWWSMMKLSLLWSVVSSEYLTWQMRCKLSEKIEISLVDDELAMMNSCVLSNATLSNDLCSLFNKNPVIKSTTEM